MHPALLHGAALDRAAVAAAEAEHKAKLLPPYTFAGHFELWDVAAGVKRRLPITFQYVLCVVCAFFASLFFYLFVYFYFFLFYFFFYFFLFRFSFCCFVLKLLLLCCVVLCCAVGIIGWTMY